MQVTKTTLQDLGACPQAIAWLQANYPNGLPATPESIALVPHPGWIDWLLQSLFGHADYAALWTAAGWQVIQPGEQGEIKERAVIFQGTATLRLRRRALLYTYGSSAPVVTVEPGGEQVSYGSSAPVVTVEQGGQQLSYGSSAPVVTVGPGGRQVSYDRSAPVVTVGPEGKQVSRDRSAPVVTVQPGGGQVSFDGSAPVVTVQPGAQQISYDRSAPVVTASGALAVRAPEH